MKRLVVFLFLLINAQVVFATEIITNGGFEVSGTGWLVTNLGSGTFYLDNNTITNISGHPTVGPADGNLYAVSDQVGPSVNVLFQTFTIPGPTSSAILSFDMFANNWTGQAPVINPIGLDYTGGPNQYGRVDILLNGADPFTTTAGLLENLYLGSDLGAFPHQYTPYQFDITSLVGAGGTFMLRFAVVDNLQNFNMGVDNVSIQTSTVSAVPEPSTFLLLGAGLVGIGFLRRRIKM